MLRFDLLVDVLVNLCFCKLASHLLNIFAIEIDHSRFVSLFLVVFRKYGLQLRELGVKRTMDRKSPVLGAIGVNMFPRLKLLFTVWSEQRPLATSIAIPIIFRIWCNMKLCPSKHTRIYRLS